MTITKVDAILLSYRLPEPLRLSYHGGERVVIKRDAMIIRVKTDKGFTGYAPGQASEKCKNIVDTLIGPFLVGKQLKDPDALRVLFRAKGSSDPYAGKVFAMCEIALWDALGRQHDLPVSELIGGRVRDRIKLYGSGGMYMPPEGYARESESVAEMGFRAYKMRPGMAPDTDVEAVRVIRDAVGPDVEIMVDAHTWWRMGNRSYQLPAVEMTAARMSEYDIYWLEEPVPPEDHDALLALKRQGIVPIASGEHENTDEGYFDLIDRECVDFVQQDIVCQGGYSSCQRVLGELSKTSLKFAFHSWGTLLEVMAAAQIGICWPEHLVEWLEYPCHRYSNNGVERKGMYPFDLASEILKAPLEVSGGDLVVPRSPGLGVEVDESVFDRYPWIPGPWSTFTLVDPPGSFAVTGDHTAKWGDDSK